MADKVLVAGAGKSGIAAAKLLTGLGGEVILYDKNETLKKHVVADNFTDEELEKIFFKFGTLKKTDVSDIKLCIISPGISLEEDFVYMLDKSNIQIWSEIQLGYKAAKGKLIAITGTNGKTTTTALTGEIMHAVYEETFVAGNIGFPYTLTAADTTDNSVTVLEVSSFQLETIIDFKPHISAILNITPDHLNRHHTMENYIMIKEEIAKNQTEEDFCVLNYDDEILREFGKSDRLKAKAVFFSSKEILDEGVYIKNGTIFVKDEKGETEIIKTSELNILGTHNHENVMAAIAIARCMKIPNDIIKRVCSQFQAVEHRIEFVTEKHGIKYFNDSKGTNPEASIQAVKAMPGPVILIAGGYDKGASYDELAKLFKGKVRYLVLMGQTKDDIAECARKYEFNDIMYVENMHEAVKVCASYAGPGDYVLLSPACASWGMFKDYEERGREFKKEVLAL